MLGTSMPDEWLGSVCDIIRASRVRDVHFAEAEQIVRRNGADLEGVLAWYGWFRSRTGDGYVHLSREGEGVVDRENEVLLTMAAFWLLHLPGQMPLRLVLTPPRNQR